MTTTTASPQTGLHRPLTVRALEIILFVLGVTALGGGTAIVFGLGTDATMLPDEWLAEFPVIDSWMVPGLVLAIGFGLGSLFVGYGMLRRPGWGWTTPIDRLTGHHWSWLGSITLGLGMILWITLQIVFLPEPSWLQVFYGTVGVALAVFPLTRSARMDLARQP